MPSNNASPCKHHMDWRAHNHSKTDLSSTESSTRGMRAHLAVPQPKIKAVGGKAWLADHVGRPSRPWLPPSPAAMWSFPIGPPMSISGDSNAPLAEKLLVPSYKYKGRGSKLSTPRCSPLLTCKGLGASRIQVWSCRSRS